MQKELDIITPEWAYPLLNPTRYKGAYGGRGSGKSHFFAEMLIEQCIINPHLKAVCVREIQKSLKFSSKQLIEDKIKALGVSSYFDITMTEIRSKQGDGIIIFQGLRDFNADSIKSLEGFDIAWVEEAQSLSDRSFKLLRPTIRKQDSELWFSWNPENETDPVDKFFRENAPNNAVSVFVNSEDNPFLPETLKLEREQDRVRMLPEDYTHVWEGGYNKKSNALIFREKYRVDYFEPKQNWVRLYGLDFGFSADPTAAIEVFVDDVSNTLYIHREANKVGLELDDTAPFIIEVMPEIVNYVVRADNSRPESISYLKRNGLPKIVGEPKLKIEDGIGFIKQFNDIVIHPQCKETIKEFGLYQYKVDKRSGDILPDIVDKYNHNIDSIRYALYPLIKVRTKINWTFS